jgi:hypothetical protein
VSSEAVLICVSGSRSRSPSRGFPARNCFKTTHLEPCCSNEFRNRDLLAVLSTALRTFSHRRLDEQNPVGPHQRHNSALRRPDLRLRLPFPSPPPCRAQCPDLVLGRKRYHQDTALTFPIREWRRIADKCRVETGLAPFSAVQRTMVENERGGTTSVVAPELARRSALFRSLFAANSKAPSKGGLINLFPAV